MPSINWTWITSPDCPTAIQQAAHGLQQIRAPKGAQALLLQGSLWIDAALARLQLNVIAMTASAETTRQTQIQAAAAL